MTSTELPRKQASDDVCVVTRSISQHPDVVSSTLSNAREQPTPDRLPLARSHSDARGDASVLPKQPVWSESLACMVSYQKS